MLKLLTIALGFSAIALFAGHTHTGYTHNICSGMSRGAIHGERLGHLTPSRPGKSQEASLILMTLLLLRDRINTFELTQ